MTGISMEAVPRKTTIRDVARAAAVGVGTISRVLNSSTQVSGETRARVLEAIRRLGFRPNAQARRILKRSTEMVCFLLSNRDFLHPFHARILQGVESYATSLKQHVLFAALHYAPRTPADRIDLPPVLQEHGLIDGLILAGTIYPNLLRRIESIHMPFVAFSNNVVGTGEEQQYDQVGFDDFNGTLQATRYLIGMGHRKIVFAGDTSYPWLHHRFEGYRQGMREKKLKSVLIMARNSQSFVDFGQKSVARILAGRPRPTAVVAGNDLVALGCYDGLKELGLDCPSDISIVGHNDMPLMDMVRPPLTTVRIRHHDMGLEAARLILQTINVSNASIVDIRLKPELVIRESTARPRATDLKI